MITKALSGLCLLFAAWIAVLATVMFVPQAAPAALVPLATAEFLAALPEHVSITDTTALGAVLVSTDSDFVAELYRAGAVIVLPAGLLGCAPLR